MKRLAGSMLTLCIVGLSFHQIAAAQVGFIDGLWFSTDTITADTPLRVYAAIRNHSGTDITGTVIFYVNDTAIKQQSIAALDNRVIEAWADWLPRTGTYTVRAVFTDITLDSIDGSSPADTQETELSTTIDVAAPVTPTTTDTEISSTTPHTSRTSAGLESYLFPSRARDILTTITDWSSSTAQALARLQADPPEPSASTTNPQTPTTSNAATPPHEATTTPTQSVGTDLLAIAKNLWAGITHTVLTVLIAILKNPLIVQVLLLGGILVVIYRSAKFFGRRSRR